jgi:Zn-finger nucleic acid-binding protein
MEAPIGARVLACMNCGGVWMDGKAYEKVAPHIDADVDLAALAASGAERARDLANSCPECAAVLVRATRSGITLDVCKSHGVWIDRGELQRIASRAGGDAESARKTTPPPPVQSPQGKEDLKKTVSASVALEGALDLIRLFF